MINVDEIDRHHTADAFNRMVFSVILLVRNRKFMDHNARSTIIILL